MLSYSRKGTWQDNTGYTWVYYGDNVNLYQFYILPKPNFVYDDSGNPILKLVTYKTDDIHSNGSGFCHFEVELTVPSEIQSAIVAHIPQQFPDAGTNIVINALDYNPGAFAIWSLNDGTSTTEIKAAASVFGANTASFTVDLTANMMATVQKILTTSGGGFDIKYVMSVPSLLQSVNAKLSFDSSIAYQYQVTHPVHHTWGSDTPGSVQQMLTDSQSSKVDIEWMIKNPPQQLVDNVSNWANQTLQTMLTSKVNEALAIAQLKSDDSFSISNVSSFTNTYSESQVIDWWIYPEATIPSLADLNKPINAFSSSVDTRQETITIYAHLPFTKDSQNSPNVPKADVKPLLLDKVTVTVKYPGLNQAEATYTFTQNGSHLFTAPYDSAHGDVFDLEYTATFQNDPGQVTGTVQNIDQGQYSLAIDSVGILTVTFDASQAFMASGGQDNPLEEVDIQFNFVNSLGLGTPISQMATISKNAPKKEAQITSLTGYPINSPYSYTVTYVYQDGTTYKAPAINNTNGFRQIIPKVNAIHETNLILAVQKTDQSPPIIDVDVNIWYEQEVTIPGTSNQPTNDSPAVFKLEPKDANGWIYAQDTFLGFINQNQPIVYSATIDSLGGQIVINAQRVANTQASIIVSPTQRYFTLEIAMTSIDWTKATYSAVEVLVTPYVAGKQQAQQSFTWNKGNNQSNYVTVPFNDGDTVTYDWKVNYIQPGSPVTSSSGSKATDIILNVPASPNS